MIRTIGPSFWFLMIALLLAFASPVRAHIEAAELAADVVWDRTTVRLELRVAIRELIYAEQPIDAVVLPDLNQDPVQVAKRHEEEVLKGFHIKYDGTTLAPRLLGSSVQDLVIGVSEEDITPRQCAVYEVEFAGGEREAGPSRIDFSMTMFMLPLDAGFQPTVLCMVTHQQARSETQRIAVIGHDETMTLRPAWPQQPAEPVVAPGAVLSKAAAAAPQPASGRSRGPMIVLVLGAVIAIVLVGVLAKRRA